MDSPFRILLSPIALIYGIVVRIRNLLFDFGFIKSVEPEKPTICVGNITVGGTGKTPHVDYLVELLTPLLKVSTLSRGYGRRTKGFRYVDITSDSAEVGDEPLQLKLKHPGVVVSVCERRVDGINRLAQDHPDLDIILLDDAFQHRYVKPGLSILLVDYNQPVTHDHFLPWGRLRDSVREKRRADIVIVTKCPDNLSREEQFRIQSELRLSDNQNLFFTRVEYGAVFPIFSGVNRNIFLSKEFKTIAIAGIANPKPFCQYLAKNTSLVGVLTFPDHFQYTQSKIHSIFDAPLKRQVPDSVFITTEKDAARIRGIKGLSDEIKQQLFYLPIGIRFLDGKEVEFNKIVFGYARKN